MGCIQKRNAISITKKKTCQLNSLNYKNNSYNIKDKYSTNCNSEKLLNNFDKNKAEKLTNQLWINVLDFLNYNELKETGKVNRMFNQNVKQKELLIKFFKKRESVNINDIEDITLHSFSILQNKNMSSSDDDLSFNEE